MKIIISGTVDIDPEQMDAAMVAAKPLIIGALTQDGCLAYDWCPDPITSGRIRVFERWTDEEALKNHFNNHWYTDMRESMGGFGIRGAENDQPRLPRRIGCAGVAARLAKSDPVLAFPPGKIGKGIVIEVSFTLRHLSQVPGGGR